MFECAGTELLAGGTTRPKPQLRFSANQWLAAARKKIATPALAMPPH